MNNDLNNIIDLNVVKFPLGSKAWHARHRVCYVVDCIGSQRRVKYIQHGNADIVWEFANVHMSEMQEIKNPYS